MEQIAQLLQERGYKVIDMYEASRPGAHVDAFLYTSYHPDIVTSFNNLTESADITLGGGHPDIESNPSPIMLNVTGLRPEQALATLEYRISHQAERK